MQLTHDIDMQIARAGHVADLGLRDIVSRLAEDAAGAGAGTFMVPGTDAENQAKSPTLTGEVAAGYGGVVCYLAAHMPSADAAAIAAGNAFGQYDTLPLMQKGRIWVRCDADAVVVANTPCLARFAADGSNTILGAFRQAAATGAVALPGAKFVSAHSDVTFFGSTQRIALVDLMLPGA